jgi:small subunit ribosomal protein S20
MANIKSAQKRISTIERRNAENRFVKATLSTKVKKLRKMIEEGNIVEAEKFSKEVYAYIDSACSKGVIHKNAASRKVGRLAAALFKAKATAQPVAEEKVEIVATVEATPAEEKPAKKTTTRKTTTKKAETTEEKPAKKTTTRKTTKKAE